MGDGKPEPALTTKEEAAARCDTKGAKEATLAPRKRESRLEPTQGAAATNALAAAAVAMITTALHTNPPRSSSSSSSSAARLATSWFPK